MSASALQPGPRMPAPHAAPRAVILVVDDDAAMRDYLRE
jgi:hypothetical protein